MEDSSYDVKCKQLFLSFRWLEAVSADEKPKFSSTTSPPEIKIIIEVGDKDIMTSKLFDTKISVFVGRDNGHNQFIAEHFLIVYEQAIDDHRIEIDTTSAEYQNSPSRKNTENVYYKDQQSRVTYGLIDINSSKFKWNSLTGLNFSCSIFFNYLGKQDMCLQTKKELLSSAQSFISDRKFHFQT